METNGDRRSIEKWGEAAIGGFQVVPDILLKKQVELGLSNNDMIVLLNITMHWWYASQRPFPRISTIAARIGKDERTVQRSMRKLTDLRLLERVIEKQPDGTDRTVCDFSGLIARLEQYVLADRDYMLRKERYGILGASLEAELS